MHKKHTAISKFLSFVLRHQPDAIGITLDLEGWTDIDALLLAAARDGQRLDRDVIQAVVATSDKKRFAISPDGLRIRAVQGHSAVSVDIDFIEQVPPEFLYHGTATRFLDAIRKDGLRPGARHYVHLSQDESTALAVGQRHGKAVVLRVKAMLMHEQGFRFFQADNGVWLTGAVPVLHIAE
ncbi:RNA 2'-phosphotransferase [Actimicrobium antarcticum]|uniref:Probable RNA 2'-phosphotransferase n=1 Tax=Actimicrobium antarcticum TaxID=1051899 RepID=A0ABP7SHE1_9BURK